MLPLEVVFTVLFGLAFGSFLNVCIVRLPRGESIAHPSSRCPACKAPIAPRDNVPLVSWLVLRGRSRCCRQPIALRYPVVEALTALLFAACLLGYGLTVTGIGMMVFCWLLLGLAWMDAETFLLPDAFTLPGIALGLVFHSLASGRSLWIGVGKSLLSAAGLAGLLLLSAVLYRLARKREGMGMGDVKLAGMLGAWLEWKLAGVALFIGVWVGALAGIGLMISSRDRSGESAENRRARLARSPLRLPFGAFLASAGIVTVFFGRAILAWYLGFFR